MNLTVVSYAYVEQLRIVCTNPKEYIGNCIYLYLFFPVVAIELRSGTELTLDEGLGLDVIVVGKTPTVVFTCYTYMRWYTIPYSYTYPITYSNSRDIVLVS